MNDRSYKIFKGVNKYDVKTLVAARLDEDFFKDVREVAIIKFEKIIRKGSNVKLIINYNDIRTTIGTIKDNIAHDLIDENKTYIKLEKGKDGYIKKEFYELINTDDEYFIDDYYYKFLPDYEKMSYRKVKSLYKNYKKVTNR